MKTSLVLGLTKPALHRARFYSGLSLALLGILGWMQTAQAIPINYTGGTYSQNFDGMGGGTLTPTGWFVGTGAGPAVTGNTVGVDTGGNPAGGSYNYGVTGVHSVQDRALGSIGDTTSATQIDTEVDIKNNSPFAITQFTISYTGEEWRNGGSGNPNSLILQLSTNGLTWINLGAVFNFTSPINSFAAGALDGNATANRVTGIGGTFTPSSAIPIGSTFYLRFADPDDPGRDSGIAIDDFTFKAVPEPSAYMLLGIGFLICGQRYVRPRSA
jgi:hypothetical protein